METPLKYYFTDAGLRNARVNVRQQEIHSLVRIGDSFKKIVIVKDAVIPWYDENGILYMGIEDFPLDKKVLESI